jgi:hypothetical protein
MGILGEASRTEIDRDLVFTQLYVRNALESLQDMKPLQCLGANSSTALPVWTGISPPG